MKRVLWAAATLAVLGTAPALAQYGGGGYGPPEYGERRRGPPEYGERRGPPEYGERRGGPYVGRPAPGPDEFDRRPRFGTTCVTRRGNVCPTIRPRPVGSSCGCEFPVVGYRPGRVQ